MHFARVGRTLLSAAFDFLIAPSSACHPESPRFSSRAEEPVLSLPKGRKPWVTSLTTTPTKSPPTLDLPGAKTPVFHVKFRR